MAVVGGVIAERVSVSSRVRVCSLDVNPRDIRQFSQLSGKIVRFHGTHVPIGAYLPCAAACAAA